MNQLSAFSPDYATARQRFRQAASRLGWELEAHPIGPTGPGGEELTIDVACSPARELTDAIVVSSGVHGVEGFFGSAVQTAWLEQGAAQARSRVRCVFLHGLNPYGFAWLRRVDEHNVDLNRNFLLPNERYEGAPAGYAELDSLLNPRRSPSTWDPFAIQALWVIVRRGIPALRQAIATGQYEFPQGLFFGGAGPSRVQQLLDANLTRWLGGSRRVVHLDFHTGLGKRGACKLLVDDPLSERHRLRLTEWFGPDSFEVSNNSRITSDVRGWLGRWCVARGFAPDYLFACAEFGSYGPIQVVAGLRAENQAHHWGNPAAASTVSAKQRLRELFCPAAPAWRSQALAHAVFLLTQALHGLSNGSDMFPVGGVP